MQLVEYFDSKPSVKNLEMHKLFKDLLETEKLIDDYACAYSREILIQGRLYVTQNWICFYSNIFTIETKIAIPFSQVIGITKERTALVIPNAITILTNNSKYPFSSFVSRDIVHSILMFIWINTQSESMKSPRELYCLARRTWGVEVPLSQSDEELWGVPKKNKNTHHAELYSADARQFVGNLTDMNSSITSTSTNTSLLNNNNNIHNDNNSSNDTNTTTILLQEPMTPSTTDSSLVSEIVNQKSNLDTNQQQQQQAESVSLFSGEQFGAQPDLISTTSEDSKLSGELDISDIYSDLETTFVEKKLRFPVDKIFHLIFEDSQFIHEFLTSRKISEHSLGEWTRQVDGTKSRKLSYRIALNYSFGPKSCVTTEDQLMSASSQPGSVYLIDVIVKNSNIPYADNFYVLNRFLLVRSGKGESLIKITSKIIFNKVSWTTPKYFIEKTVYDGQLTYFQSLQQFMMDWVEAHQHETRKQKSRKMSLRMQKVPSEHSLNQEFLPITTIPELELITPTHFLSTEASEIESTTSNEIETSIFKVLEKYHKLILLLFILLLGLNCVWLLKSLFTSPTLESEKEVPVSIDVDNFNWPTSQKGWISLVTNQQQAYQQELEILKSYFDNVLEQLNKTSEAIRELRKLTEGAVIGDVLESIKYNSECDSKDSSSGRSD